MLCHRFWRQGRREKEEIKANSRGLLVLEPHLGQPKPEPELRNVSLMGDFYIYMFVNFEEISGKKHLFDMYTLLTLGE